MDLKNNVNFVKMVSMATLRVLKNLDAKVSYRNYRVSQEYVTHLNPSTSLLFRFLSFHSVSFCSIFVPFFSVPFRSAVFCFNLFRFISLHSVLFRSI